MKNVYFSFLMLLSVSAITAQSITFTNGGGDRLWSNTANWAGGALPTSTNFVATSQNNSIVDANFTIARIQNFAGTTGAVSYGGGGSGIVTIDIASGSAVLGIANFSNNDVVLSFAGNITIDNSDVSNANTLMRNDNGTSAGNSIEFEAGSVLTLETNLEARSSGGGNIFNFNGTLAGTAALRFSANTINTFGSTSDNTGHGGDLVWVGANASVVVNSADNNVFLPVDRKIQINAINGSIDVNGANVYQGNISINGSNAFTFNANNDQNSMGLIVFSGGSADGTLNLTIDNSVTNLSFADNSASDWASGTINITGFQEGVIKFGSNNNGLTSTQLSQINVVGGTGPVALNSSGALVYQSSLSNKDFDFDSNKRISYPSVASDILTFSKSQENIKIFDLTGKMVLQNLKVNQTELTVHTLRSGIYLIQFDNSKVEKFIKQ